MASRNKNKTSGLRILWIPGGRNKSQSKGRYDVTNKKITNQRKNEIWSMGGSKSHRDFLTSESDTSPLPDGPFIPTNLSTCGIGAVTTIRSGKCADDVNDDILAENISGSTIAPHTSTDLTPIADSATIISRKIELTDPKQIDLTKINDIIMPAKYHQPTPVIITSTTTAEIMDENRYKVFLKNGATDEDSFDADICFPKPPNGTCNTSAGAGGDGTHNLPLNISAMSTTSTTTIPPISSNKIDSRTSSPTKKKSPHKFYNNNQSDVNSIESVTPNNASNVPSNNLDWIDDLVQDHISNKKQHNLEKKKTKKKKNVKELDQIDGISMKQKENDSMNIEDDEKVVKCLYYTIMCCDCSIS